MALGVSKRLYLVPALRQWLLKRGWQPFKFQRETWQAIAADRSGLVHATTGAGKTYAVWLGILNKALRNATSERTPPGLRVVWITPMRALAADTLRALAPPLEAVGLNWTIASRTGDTTSAQRQRQAKRLPTALITTPESLTLLIARADALSQLNGVTHVIVDEWHELLGSKRGTQTMLALARLARFNPQIRVWGLSATLNNLEVALNALTGNALPSGVLIRGLEPKRLVVDTLVPAHIERFPWGGHLGTRLVQAVAKEIDGSASTLAFTNTRSQAELWFQSLINVRPDWAGIIALHHGSLDRRERNWVEMALKEGRLKAVVATSSLDLGVDFFPVERVFQIGSAKGVARLLQRAGRSGHAPGRPSRITLVPTHALELIEAAAAREAAKTKIVEPRTPAEKPLDVLIQHLVTVALGGGFTVDTLFEEVRTAYPYRNLTRADFEWCLAFVERGGNSLVAYPEYHRVVMDDQGCYRVPRKDIARRHRMSVGTITADAMMRVAWMRGSNLGTVEEGFIARLRPGDAFTFGGRILELVRVHDMTAYVRKAKRQRGSVPRWNGSSMPLSSELADATLAMLERAYANDYSAPEMAAIRPLLTLQQSWSALPRTGVLVCELLHSREGHHFYCYPFAGRLAHVGIGSLLAYRAGRELPGTFSISTNDYGFEIVSTKDFGWDELIAQDLFSTEHLIRDMLASLDVSQLPQRRFREIARIAGLVFAGFPGAHKSARQLQASSGLFYEVFRKYDVDNLLLSQARQEALERELDIDRLHATLIRMQQWQVRITRPKRYTPFAFPLMAERLREKVSTETAASRITRLIAELEKAASREPSLQSFQDESVHT